MKKELKALYHRVGSKTFKHGLQNGIRLIVLLLLALIFGKLLSSCSNKDDNVKIYQVYTPAVTWQTTNDVPILKEPLETQTVFYVIGE